MKVYLKQPNYLHKRGDKEENEDFIFPIPGDVSAESRLFIVADGDKGSSKGTQSHGGVAAQSVAMGFANQFLNLLKEGDADQAFLESSLTYVQGTLLSYFGKRSEYEGSKASFCLLHFGSNKASLAWVGESQVYYYNSKHNTIHSSSQWEADMENPQRSAWIDGRSPVQVRHKYFALEDLNNDDVFFLASGGLSNHLDPASLKSIFHNVNVAKGGPEKMLAEIEDLILPDQQKEDQSCYLVSIAAVGIGAKPEAATAEAASASGNSTPLTEPAPGRDRLARSLGWIFGGSLLVLLISLVVVAALEKNSNPFKNLVKQSSEHLQAGREANLDQDFGKGKDEFDMALHLLDSASQLATKPAELDQIDSIRKEIHAYLAISPASIDLNEIPLDQLTLTAEEYVNEGKEFFDKGNIISAYHSFRNAQRLMEAGKSGDTKLPADLVAETFIRLANQLYLQPNRDCQVVNQVYDRGFQLYPAASNEGVTLPEWVQTARINQGSCTAILAELQRRTGDSTVVPANKPADQPVASASNQRSRSLAPASSSSTSGQPASPRTSSPATSNSRLAAPTSSAAPAVRSATTTATAAQKKALSEGMRLYEEAKAKNSPYLFKASAQQFEKAGPALDGPGAYLLAYLYHQGVGVQANSTKALQYAKQSALQQWAAGEYLYGFLLLERQNRRDTLTAISSLKLSANQLYVDAVRKLQDLGVSP